MSFDPLTSIFELGKTAIERLWPDPIRRAEEMRKLEALRQKGSESVLNAHVKLMLAQIDVNKVEAAHKSLFVAGWRSFIGWVGGFSLAYSGIIHPLLVWVWTTLVAFDIIPKGVEPPPYIENAMLGTILMGMLGIGSMRSFDKLKGTQTDSISKKK